MVYNRTKFISPTNVDASKAHCLEAGLEGLLEFSKAPSIKDILCMLQICRKTKNVASAKLLYSYICGQGLLDDRSIGNHLIPLFVDCGSLQDAKMVFSSLSYRNEHSWTSLILGYARSEQILHAFCLYQRMQENSILPTSYTLVGLLQSCAQLQNSEFGQEIHLEVVQKGFDVDLFIHSALIDMYVKCGSILDAQNVFDRMSNRDVVLWTTLIAGYAEHGPVEDALKSFEKMQDEGILPNTFSFSCVLKACGKTEAIDEGHGMHMHITYKGFEKDFFLGKSIVSMYVKCGALSDAWGVFIKLPVQDVVSWTSLLVGYTDDGPSEEAFNCFKEMQMQGILPDAFSFSNILRACSNAGSIEKGFEIHKEIIHEGFEKDLVVGSALISMYVLCGSFVEAQEVFDELPRHCVVAWNALIGGFVEYGTAEKALDSFDKMQGDGIFPDAYTFAHVLKVCGLLGATDKGQSIYMEAVVKGFERECFVGSTLVGMYVKLKLLEEARAVFDQLEVKEVVAWTALITGYVEHGPAKEALECFENMQSMGIPLDNFTFASMLKACGSMGAILKGYEMHREVLKKGFELDLYVGTSLLDMYVKSGSPQEAQVMFDKLTIRDVASWNALISGLADHEGNLALNCFANMQHEGVKPDSITFSCLLTACSHSSLVMEGRRFFKTMIEKYGLTPTIDHYTCMIDLLARTGNLCEAAKYLESTPSPPSIETWRALLYACKLYGETELGSRCFHHLAQIDSELAALADVYTGSEAWDNIIAMDGY